MKRLFAITALLACLTLSKGLTAQTPAASAVPGVVTVTFNAAVLQTAEAQRQIAALQTKYAPREAQLKTLNDQIAEIQKQLQTSGDKLSDAERASREQSLSTKQKQLERDSEDYKTDTAADSQQVFQNVAQKVYAFLETYARQHGYSMVVERGSLQQPVVWYSAANLDITDDLTKAYDAQAGSAAPAANKPAGAGVTRPSAANPAKPSGPSTPAPK
jgi:outer membrane protein